MNDPDEVIRLYRQLTEDQRTFITRLQRQVEAQGRIIPILCDLIKDPAVKASILADIETTMKELATI